MAWVAAASIGAQVVGGLMSSDNAGDAAKSASEAQSAASQRGIEEQRRQFDALQALLKPYSDAGAGALKGQQDLLGLNGAPSAAFAIDQIKNGPQFTAMQKTGENSILANASATGGLRGGNVQGALAQFSPQLLSQLIDSQYAKLGGITSIGQNAAAGTGNAGMAMAGNIGNLLQQQGAAQAGGILGAARADNQGINAIVNGVGQVAGRFPNGFNAPPIPGAVPGGTMSGGPNIDLFANVA